jgi:opacity protein-like surface antigen
MKRIVILALLVTGLMAAEGQDYFGLNAGRAELRATSDANHAKVDDTHYSLTLGHYYNDNGRISATYSYVDADSVVDTSDALTVAYDFILPVANDKVFLYAGPLVGYTRYEEPGLDLSGFHYGAEAGVIVPVIENIEVEAGYRYAIETGSDTIAGISIDADDLRMWYVGANLRF